VPNPIRRSVRQAVWGWERRRPRARASSCNKSPTAMSTDPARAEGHGSNPVYGSEELGPEVIDGGIA
jgi:hypothetical protein